MSTPAIRLLPADPPAPRSARIPRGRARRWLAQFENGAAQPGLDEAVPASPAVAVFFTQRAFVRCCAHAGSDLDNEVGGWLVGKWRYDKRSGEQFIIVEAILPAPHTRHGSAYLTFTQDTQLTLYNQMKERHPGKELVGWYHTHPRMGVFLSSYDTWLHNNFFPEPFQVALVIEPFSASGGFFIRQPDGALDPRRYYGFYELCSPGRRSVVHWRNLAAGPPHTSTAAQEGGIIDGG